MSDRNQEIWNACYATRRTDARMAGGRVEIMAYDHANAVRFRTDRTMSRLQRAIERVNRDVRRLRRHAGTVVRLEVAEDETLSARFITENGALTADFVEQIASQVGGFTGPVETLLPPEDDENG